jgi:hypothetical protein
MTDKPILFSAPMVRALLAGTKTQTRRLLKQEIDPHCVEVHRYSDDDPTFIQRHGMDGSICGKVDVPYEVGDRLSVYEGIKENNIPVPITLLVTDVRVQRLQDISEEGARAEGATARNGFYKNPDWSMDWSRVDNGTAKQEDIALGSAKWAFLEYIRGLHGESDIDWNPWVCAISFTVHKCNIDKME